jgi:hypothetical protein
MPQVVIDNPILNSPYKEPTRHFKFSDEDITNEIIEFPDFVWQWRRVLFDKRLIRTINSGRCFALIGLGSSCEVGYRSWSKLAEETFKSLEVASYKIDESYERYLSRNKYPELFRQAEIDIGNRISLLTLVKKLLYPDTEKPSPIYDFMIRWPFACYPTNFDDEILTDLILSPSV